MEEDLYVIQNLHGLIRPHLPCDQSRILAVKYSKFGTDDYGLRILKVLVELVNTTTGEDWILEALAKVLPRHCPDLVKARFAREIGVHTSIQNTIDLFLREKGDKADFFACSFGGRLNLNGNKEIDNNAVLVLEDCEASVCGSSIYTLMDTKIGFNLETTQAILKSLAKFHTSTIALKLQNPEEFNTKILSNLPQIDEQQRFSIEIIENVRESWSTFCHGNLQIKNILIRNAEIKFINFQECQYNSPLTDVLYFLFSSVQLEVLHQHLDNLIELYFTNFHLFLRQFNNDNNSNFSRHSFNQELKTTASKYQLFYKTLNVELGKEFDKLINK
ncbi:unnamed protein product [Ceutorhynchus assimilis]|uniref:CHK kinase-like domain-containing protein n=1 Tax=Ceutorhynchus assimilis TaxID=467358 RepID=A0A9N9QFP8_9CUCU|nr:unnamed protein product [Ceutorhynchus assimilis]